MNHQQEFRVTTKNAGLIGFAAAGGAILGFFLQLLVAYYFGADNRTDAYFMAQSTSELLSKLLLGGSIASLFIPMFIASKKKEGDQAANTLALHIFHLTSALFLILIAVIAVFTPQFIRFIAPGFDGETSALAVHMLRILLPSFLFLFWVDLGTGILHSLNRFAIPAKARLIAPLSSIIALTALAPTIGIYALAIGAATGATLQMIFIALALKRAGLSYRFAFNPRHPGIIHLFHLVYPFIFSMLFTQAAGITYRILVSDLPGGSLTALKFAEKITQLATIIFITSIISAIYPTLAAKVSQGGGAALRQSLRSAMRLILFISVPLVVGLATLRTPLIAFIYERGSFTALNTAETSLALLYFSIGLATNGISTLFGYATLALQKTKISVAVTIISQISAIALFFVLVPIMGHAGLALASSLVPLVSGSLYIWYISRHVKKLHQIFFDTIYCKIAALTVTLYLTVQLVLAGLRLLPLSPAPANFVQVTVPAICGAAVYAFLAYAWQIPEAREAASILKQKLAKISLL